LAKAGDLETKAQARRAQAEGKLQAAQAQAPPEACAAREELNDEIAAAYQQRQERQAPSPPGGRCRGQRGQIHAHLPANQPFSVRRSLQPGDDPRPGPVALPAAE
jgi:1,6-anhydro-N-acetylmuramate kinase